MKTTNEILQKNGLWAISLYRNGRLVGSWSNIQEDDAKAMKHNWISFGRISRDWPGSYQGGVYVSYIPEIELVEA